MGFLDLLIGKKSVPKQGADPIAKDPRITAIGNTEPVCPYCNHKFDKMPLKKKQCPNCKKFIRSRTRPFDNKKVLIKEEQVEELEFQWAIFNGTTELWIHNKAEREVENLEHEEIRRQLKVKFGSEPRGNDVEWGYLNRKSIKMASQGKWGMYRNCRFDMAVLLEKEKKYPLAIGMLIEVFALDLNDKGASFVAPGVIKTILKNAEKGNISREDLKKQFIERYDVVRTSLKLKKSTDMALETFESSVALPELD